MRTFISFSARAGGNCDKIAEYLKRDGDKAIFFRDLDITGCKNCNYECCTSYCKYHDDSIYSLYDSFKNCEKVVLIVPIYCGNPSSLYFIFNERCQDYFMHNEMEYENILRRLYIIGVCGDTVHSPDFIPCLEKWFNHTKYSNHVLGLERHRYDLKLNDCVLDVEELKDKIDEFINPTKAQIEESAMAAVVCKDKILATNELIYGKNTLSLPKGHREENEDIVDTAIRECFEETNILITRDNLAGKLDPFSYEFLTPSNTLIRKTIYPFLFRVDDEGEPLAKEKRITSVKWIKIDEFTDSCTHDTVKKIAKQIKKFLRS